MRYKALVFDFFGVICSEVSTFWFKEHLPNQITELQQRYVRPADRGDTTQEELLRQLSNISTVPPREIEQDWIGRSRLDTELIDFIKELKGGYKLGLLSNATSPFFHLVAKPIEDAALFDHIVISSEAGYAKPEPEIYQAILSKLDVRPADALMIDDNQANVDGAERVGMPGHQYTSLQELRDFLLK